MIVTMRTVCYRPACLMTLFLGAVLLAFGCQNRQTTSYKQSSQAIPVIIGPVVRKQMPVEVSAVGSVEAYREVSVVAQVNGRVEKVHFREGDAVRRGDILFSLDSRPFEAVLSQAQAQLDRDRLLATNTKNDFKRYQALVDKDYVSQEQFEKLQTQVAVSEATLRADQSALKTAKLNLQYTTIRSPIDGRTGTLLVDQGNVVKANDKPLVVIRQVQPIYVRFAVPEKYLSRIRHYITREKLRVQASVPDMKDETSLGELTFMDNTVDVATGTVSLKAQFENSQERLWPGQYVDVKLQLSFETDALVIPAVAVQQSSEGEFVFVLRENKTVAIRKIKVSRTDKELAVVVEGLKPGEEVVTDGQFQLAEGSSVSIKQKRTDETRTNNLKTTHAETTSPDPSLKAQ